MDPMSCLLEALDARRPEMPDAPVLDRVGRPALLAVDEEGRAVDPRPELLDLALGHVVGRPGADVIVELPAIGAVLVLVDAVLRQVPRLLWREMLVRLLHALERFFDRGVAPRQAAGEAALLLDPFLHALGDAPLGALGEPLGRGTQPFDGDEPLHL